MSRTSRVTLRAALVLGLALPATVFARAAGYSSAGCEGCHSGGSLPTVTTQVSAESIAPGATATVTVEIAAVNGNVGGFSLYRLASGTETTSAGSFGLIDNQTKLGTTAGIVVHSSPKGAAGDKVTFQVRFTAPASGQGGVDFRAYGLSANGNGQQTGDYGTSQAAQASLVWGCAGAVYYRDNDGDGHGSMESGWTRACTQPAGFSTANDDCGDSDERLKPGATETCNKKDDDCDGQTDEGLAVTNTFYPDKDGDGYGVPGTTTTAQGCTPPAGFGLTPNDCNDSDTTVNPGKTEVCNGKDDDCDGRIDEGVTPTCGVGMCRRNAPACRQDLCTPAAPTVEKCNGLDDDCDEEIDEDGNLCASGMACNVGQCVPVTSLPDGNGNVPLPDGGTAPGPDGNGDGGKSSGGGCSTGGATGALALGTWVLVTRLRKRVRRSALPRSPRGSPEPSRGA